MRLSCFSKTLINHEADQKKGGTGFEGQDKRCKRGRREGWCGQLKRKQLQDNAAQQVQRDCYEQRFKDIGVLKSSYRESFKTAERIKETRGLHQISNKRGEGALRGEQKPESFSTRSSYRDIAAAGQFHRQHITTTQRQEGSIRNRQTLQRQAMNGSAEWTQQEEGSTGHLPD